MTSMGLSLGIQKIGKQIFQKQRYYPLPSFQEIMTTTGYGFMLKTIKTTYLQSSGGRVRSKITRESSIKILYLIIFQRLKQPKLRDLWKLRLFFKKII